MLPPSSWWLNLVKVNNEVIGIKKRALYVGMLQGEIQSTTFLIPITLALAWNQFGYPEDVGRLFVRNIRATFYHTHTLMQRTIIWAAAVVEARKFKSTLLPIFFYRGPTDKFCTFREVSRTTGWRPLLIPVYCIKRTRETTVGVNR